MHLPRHTPVKMLRTPMSLSPRIGTQVDTSLTCSSTSFMDFMTRCGKHTSTGKYPSGISTSPLRRINLLTKPTGLLVLSPILVAALPTTSASTRVSNPRELQSCGLSTPERSLSCQSSSAIGLSSVAHFSLPLQSSSSRSRITSQSRKILLQPTILWKRLHQPSLTSSKPASDFSPYFNFRLRTLSCGVGPGSVPMT